MSATTKTTITIQNIKERSDDLKVKLSQAEYADARAKTELEGVLDRISALTRVDLSDRELDLISGFLDGVKKLESPLDAETCNRLIETSRLFKYRVLFFAEQSKHNIAKLAANDLRAHCIELLMALKDPADRKKIPDDFESISFERLFKVCCDIDTARKERMYACVENLIQALNDLHEREYFNDEKYGSFRDSLARIGIVYSRETNRFSLKDNYNKDLVMALFEEPIDCYLPERGDSGILDFNGRNDREAALARAWASFKEEHQNYRAKDNSGVSVNLGLYILKHHAEALDRRIEVQCEHCMEKIQAVENPTAAQLDLREWLNLEYFLEVRILPYHGVMKEKFREGMLDLLIELEAALDKPRGENTEQELQDLLEKILRVRAPVIKDLLSKERAALQAEERSVELGERGLAAQESIFQELTEALEVTKRRLSLQGLQTQRQSMEHANVVEQLAEKQVILEEVQTQLSGMTEEKSVLETDQQRNKEQMTTLEKKVRKESATVEKDTAAYDKAHTSLQRYDAVLSELGDDGVQKGLAELEMRIKALKGARSADEPDTVPQGFTEFSDHLKRWENVDIDVSAMVLQTLDPNGYKNFVIESARLHEATPKEEIPQIFSSLQSQLDASSQIIRKSELERLKGDVLTDIHALTTQHTHLAEKSTGFFSSISRAFRSDTTKNLANQLAGIKRKLSVVGVDEATILEQIEEFKALLADPQLRASGTTTAKDGQNSRQAHMDYLHSRWQHEGENALNIYVGSAVKPIMEAMQRCNQFKPKLQEKRDAKAREVEALGLKLDDSTKALAGSEAAAVKLAEELRTTGEAIERLSGQEREFKEESKKLEGAIQALKDEEEGLRLEIETAKKSKKILLGHQSAQLEKVAEAEKALEQKTNETEPRRADVENRKRALETAYSALGYFGKPYLTIAESEQLEAPSAAESEQLEAPSAPQSISEIKKRINALEIQNEIAANAILLAIDAFLDDDTFDQKSVFTVDDMCDEDDLRKLKEHMLEMYKILNECGNFYDFYECAYHQLKDYKHEVERYSEGCPDNEVMKALADNFPDYVEQLKDIGKNNEALKGLRAQLSVENAKQQKAAEATQKMLESESLEEKMRVDALREQEKIDALRGKTKMEKSEEVEQRQTITPYSVQELSRPRPPELSPGAKAFSTEQMPPHMKTGGHGPGFFSGSSHQQGVDPKKDAKPNIILSNTTAHGK